MASKYDDELKQRAVRMLAEARPEQPSVHATCRHVGGLLGIPHDTLRLWFRQYEIDSGVRPGEGKDLVAENKRLQRENAELRRANEVLKAASVFFAQELDRPRAR